LCCLHILGVFAPLGQVDCREGVVVDVESAVRRLLVVWARLDQFAPVKRVRVV